MKDLSRYSRQMLLPEIGEEGQKKISQGRAAIIGLGALGSASAGLLTRAGVGELFLIDRDFLEKSNLQRQSLYEEEDLQTRLPKAVLAQRKLQKMNSEIHVRAEVADLNTSNIVQLLSDVDVIVDGTDNFETRFLINDFSLKHKTPWIYGGVVGTQGRSYVVLPSQGPCLRCLFTELPRPEEIQTCDHAGILAPIAQIIASFQAAEALKLLAGRTDAIDRKLLSIQIWNRSFRTLDVSRLSEKKCLGCLGLEYPYLESRQGTRAVSLCGRNMVQIVNETREPLDFKKLYEKLHALIKVEYNAYLLRCSWEGFEMTVFPNGRALIQGTEDFGKARSLYAKYIGA